MRSHLKILNDHSYDLQAKDYNVHTRIDIYSALAVASKLPTRRLNSNCTQQYPISRQKIIALKVQDRNASKAVGRTFIKIQSW